MAISAKKSERIGKLLLQKDLLNNEALDQALLNQGKFGGLLGESLIRMGLINEDNFYKALSEQLNLDYVRLKNINVPQAVITEIPAKFACHYELMPIEIKDNSLTVAVSNLLDIHIQDDIKLLLKKNIRMVLASKSDIIEAIKKYYGVGADTIEKISPELSQDKFISLQSQETEDLVDSSNDASIIKFVNQILLEAYRDRATDIHIEPYEDELIIRYRIDGILYETKIPNTVKNFQSAIISRIKIMANLNIAERRLPQDGRIKVKIGDDEVDLRVSILPTPFGESVVISPF